MTAFRRAVLAICFCSLASACASAPISIATSSLPGSAAATTPAHRHLDQSVDQFNADLVERGLIREAGSMGAAMRWMNQLAGQADEGEGNTLSHYLDARAVDLSDADAIARVRADIVQVWQGAAEIDAGSRALLVEGAGLSRSHVTDALADVEGAMANARIAQSVFEAAMLDMVALHDAAALSGLRVERDLLALRINDLRDRADELAELRRQMRNPSIS